MRIVFHLKYFRAGRIGGQESVIRQLAAGLERNPLATGQRLVALCPSEESAAVEGICHWDAVELIAADGGDRGMAQALSKVAPDLYVCPMAIVEPPDPRCPTVVGVPDLQHETYPEFFPVDVLANRRKSYGNAIRRADLVLTLSEYARGTIRACYPEVTPDRVIAAHPGLAPSFAAALASPDADTPHKLALPPNYLLFPANFWPHKNHSTLLRALAKLRGQGCTPFLVLTGDPGSGFERIENEIRSLGLESQVRFLGRVETREFVSLLRGARALVFPSLYEGFGLPILEAFHCDTPVLCSNAASCPEVAGDAALLVNPHSLDELADKLRHIWEDAELRADLVVRGRRRREELAAASSFEKIRAALLWALNNPKPRPGILRRLFGG
ncbi:MAG: glycosyltransferase family 1 protein [Bryobacterales bacterium]